MLVLRDKDRIDLGGLRCADRRHRPAGGAAAIALADRAPDLTTCLVDAGSRDREPIGESAPPQIRPILAHLGLWADFVEGGHEAAYRTRSAWATPRLESNEFLCQVQQVGWRLDRSRFDAMMQREAKRRATAWVTGTIDHAVFGDGLWHVQLRDGATLTSRAIVDATGRAAVPARSQGLRPTRLDRLVGCFRCFDDESAGQRELMIEAVPDGWWYTVALPAGQRVVAFMTDADLARRGRLSEGAQWLAALRRTEHIAAATARARPAGAVRLHGAGSQIMIGRAVGPLLCIGDAASSFDPVSGQGIVKALRSAIFASYALIDWFRRGDEGTLKRYRAFIEAEFTAYHQIWQDYYAVEHRWPDSLFWRRRHRSSRRTTVQASEARSSGSRTGDLLEAGGRVRDPPP